MSEQSANNRMSRRAVLGACATMAAGLALPDRALAGEGTLYVGGVEITLGIESLLRQLWGPLAGWSGTPIGQYITNEPLLTRTAMHQGPPIAVYFAERNTRVAPRATGYRFQRAAPTYFDSLMQLQGFTTASITGEAMRIWGAPTSPPFEMAFLGRKYFGQWFDRAIDGFPRFVVSVTFIQLDGRETQRVLPLKRQAAKVAERTIKQGTLEGAGPRLRQMIHHPDGFSQESSDVPAIT